MWKWKSHKNKRKISNSTNSLCYSFFSREPASDISFLYNTWHRICYCFYISRGSPWKCCGNKMSASYSKWKSASNFLEKEREFCVHEKICSCLDVISTYKFVDRKTHLDRVLARMKSQHNWRFFHIIAWKFSMTKSLQFYAEKILTTVFININIFKYLVCVEEIKKSLVQNIATWRHR